MFKRILIATDGSPFAAKAAKAGVALAGKLGARVVGCNVVEELQPAFSPRLAVNRQMVTEFNQRACAAGQKHVDAIGKLAAKQGIPFTAAVIRGSRPHEGIAYAAKRNKCDAIFIAAQGQGALSRLLMGSVTQKVLAHSKVPVIVFR